MSIDDLMAVIVPLLPVFIIGLGLFVAAVAISTFWDSHFRWILCREFWRRS